MIPKECKRLAEVDFPIAAVSKHSAREKSIRHGHPSTLHLWWARRPLAACRAILLGLLLPDPCDPNCPEGFKTKARVILTPLPQSVEPDDEGLRKSLLRFIGDFANWDLADNPTYLEASRALVKAAHPEETPLVVDPFAGGGSIPLEALRLGCEAFASDLNPVAYNILKVMLEDIPRYGLELAVEIRRISKEIKKHLERELTEFYPGDDNGATPIAYLWARTVICESPNCGAEIPLLRSFWLCKKSNRKQALKYNIKRDKGGLPQVEFEIFKPKNEKEVPCNTIARAKATCLCCGSVLPPERVRAQLSEQRGGADVVFNKKGKRISGARMLAVVTLLPGTQGRQYRLSTERDYIGVWKTQKRLEKIVDDWEHGGKNGFNPVPDEPTPVGGGSGAGRAFSLRRYGMTAFSDLFTRRQRLALATLALEVRKCSMDVGNQQITQRTLAIISSRCSDYNSAYAHWANSGEFVGNTFGRQALGPAWDFCETAILKTESGSYDGAVEWVAKVVEKQQVLKTFIGQVALNDACVSPLPDETATIWFTDPPYYDAVPYSDLSDYFYVWLKRAMDMVTLSANPSLQSNQLTPKDCELVQDETKNWNNKPKDRQFFEDRICDAFHEGSRVLAKTGIGCVVFAHKTTEGWEALLGGMIRAGWTLVASWPIASERPGRLRSQNSAALATSVHLVCRPRPQDAPVGDWGEVLKELPKRVGDWMERLQSEGVRGADLVFACIGPALEIFSRYSKVETADGLEVKLAEYLKKVWEVVGRTALEQVLGTAEALARNGAAGVLEEDARLTALFLWTLQSTEQGKSEKEKGKNAEEVIEEVEDGADEEGTGLTGKTKGYCLPFDVVRRFAQPLGIDLSKWAGRVIETDKGVVRLMAVSERAKQLFGEKGTESVADWLERDPDKNLQQALFPREESKKVKGKSKKENRKGKKGLMEISLTSSSEDKLLPFDFSLLPSREREATTLDRIHAAMLLQASGQANALRALIKAEQDRGQDFLRLANALSALYPTASEEKRLLDAMLLAVPR